MGNMITRFAENGLHVFGDNAFIFYDQNFSLIHRFRIMGVCWAHKART